MLLNLIEVPSELVQKQICHCVSEHKRGYSRIFTHLSFSSVFFYCLKIASSVLNFCTLPGGHIWTSRTHPPSPRCLASSRGWRGRWRWRPPWPRSCPWPGWACRGGRRPGGWRSPPGAHSYWPGHSGEASWGRTPPAMSTWHTMWGMTRWPVAVRRLTLTCTVCCSAPVSSLRLTAW